jgi:hypothetical protein
LFRAQTLYVGIEPAFIVHKMSRLSVLVAGAYLTTFLRDAFVVFHASESGLVDPAVLSMSAGSAAAAFVGLVLLLNYGSGVAIRIGPWISVAAIVSVCMWAVLPFLGFAGLVASSLTLFHISQTRAAANGRLFFVTIGNLLSSGSSVLVWLAFGLDGVHFLLIGYLVGPVFQTGIATWCGRNAPHPARQGLIDPGSGRKIVALAGLAQLAPLLARFTFVGQPPGEVTMASLVLTLLLSATIVVAAPSATLRLADQAAPSSEAVVKLIWKLTSLGMGLIVAALASDATDLFQIPDRLLHFLHHASFAVPGAPAVTYLYLRVRSRAERSSALTSILLGSLTVQVLFSFVVRRLPSGFGIQILPFTISQILAMLLDMRSQNHRGRNSTMRIERETMSVVKTLPTASAVEQEVNKQFAILKAFDARSDGQFRMPSIVAIDIAQNSFKMEWISDARALYMIHRFRGLDGKEQLRSCFVRAGKALAVIHSLAPSSEVWSETPRVERLLGIYEKRFVKLFPDLPVPSLRPEELSGEDLCLAHGDFGLSNLLATQSGELIVIDSSPNNQTSFKCLEGTPREVDLAFLYSCLAGRLPVASLIVTSPRYRMELFGILLEAYEGEAGCKVDRKVVTALGEAITIDYLPNRFSRWSRPVVSAFVLNGTHRRKLVVS